MPQLTLGQIASYAKMVGWEGEDVVIATALTPCESDRRTDAHNKSSNAIGLLQVRPDANPGLPAIYKGPIGALTLRNPADNMRAAKIIWDSRKAETGNGWSAWEAYTNGCYRRHMDEARAAAGGAQPIHATDPQLVGPGDGIGAIAAVLAQVGKMLEAGYRWMADAGNWVRVVQVGGGIGLIVLGTGIVAGKPVLAAVPGPIKPLVRSANARR